MHDPCSTPTNSLPTTEPPEPERLLLATGDRARETLNLLRRSLVLTERDGHPYVRLECIDPSVMQLSPLEQRGVAHRIASVNTAFARGDIELIPGGSGVRLVNRPAALDALAPGLFDGDRVKRGGISLLANVGGQWLPPGVTVDLTPGETNDLLAALTLGSLAAVETALSSFGLAAEVALPAAIALLAAAAVVFICQGISATGAVGFKFTLIPLLVVVPYPV